MNKLKALMTIQLLGFFNLNKIKHSGTKKEKVMAVFFLVAIVLLTLMLESYLIGLTLSWVFFGLTAFIPNLLSFLTFIIIFCLTFFQSNGSLFGFKDFDLLISLPVSTKLFMISRVLFSYLVNLAVAFLTFFLPLIIYWRAGYFNWLALGMATVALIVMPLLPMILATAINLLITAIASRYRHTNLVMNLLTVGVVLGLCFYSLNFQNSSLVAVSELATVLSQSLNKFYPLGNWLKLALQQQNWLYFLGFIAVPLLSLSLIIGGLAPIYLALNSRLAARPTTSRTSWKKIKSQTVLWALYKKEWQLYLASPLYLTNTMIGSLLLLGFSVILFFQPLNSLEKFLTVPNLAETINSHLILIPMLISCFFALGTPTAAAISIEGQKRWLAATLPVKLSSLYQGKLLLHLSIIVPTTLISVLAFSRNFHLQGLTLLFSLLFPVVYGLYIGMVGLLLDSRHARFDWKSEQQVVKQSVTVFLSLLINLLTLIAASSFLLVLPQIRVLVGLTVLLLLISYFLYRQLLKKNPFVLQ